jgi:putative nucleotidyltransferase with HDIG domain
MLQTDRLPPLPHAQTQALSALNDPDVSLVDVAEVIETDPALTATMLRAANSASSAPVDRVVSARIAAIRIGLRPTRNLVMGTVMTSLSTDFGRAGVDADELWRHALASALIADGAVRDDEAARSAGFTAGLMHDIGRIAMAQVEPERYSEVMAKVRIGADPLEAEVEVFGSDHTTWGADVARAWQIPEEIVTAIAEHHGMPDDTLSHAVAGAHGVIHSLGIGNGLPVPAGEQAEPTALDPEQEELLGQIGGADDLFAQIDWFREAFSVAA